MRRPSAFSLYELRRRKPRGGLGRSTGTRPSRRLGWSLAVEGVILAVVEWYGLTYGLAHTH